MNLDETLGIPSFVILLLRPSTIESVHFSYSHTIRSGYEIIRHAI